MPTFDYDAQPGAPVPVLVGTTASRGAYAIRGFLTRNGYPFEWVDASQPDAVRAVLGVAEVEPSALALCILPDGSPLASATVERVGRVWAWSRPRRGRNTTWRSSERGRPVWRGLRRSDIPPLGPATLVSGLAERRDHLIPDRALRRLAARHLQFDRLEQAAIPLHLIAFDLLAGTEVRLSDGPLADAVLAAAVIPGVLPPVRWRGRLLADGGLDEPTRPGSALARCAVPFDASQVKDLALARLGRGAGDDHTGCALRWPSTVEST
jgi:hypothetical protein